MDILIENKLNTILMKEISDDRTILTLNEIEDFENEHGIKVPDDYKEFLSKYYSCYVRDEFSFPMIEKSSITNDDGLEKIMFFYNKEFITMADRFSEIWGNKVLPIGEGLGGDYICIGIHASNFGKIFVLYHEDDERQDCLYLASNSFNNYILSFVDEE